MKIKSLVGLLCGLVLLAGPAADQKKKCPALLTVKREVRAVVEAPEVKPAAPKKEERPHQGQQNKL